MDGVQIKFDDERVVCDAGIALVATLVLRLGIEALAGELVVEHRLSHDPECDRRERQCRDERGRRSSAALGSSISAGAADAPAARVLGRFECAAERCARVVATAVRVPVVMGPEAGRYSLHAEARDDRCDDRCDDRQ